jgi:hypothetical protein
MFRIGIAACAVLVLMQRISRPRSLSKTNAFDLLVTVAPGFTLATVLLNANVRLFGGILELMLLVWLQFVITWLSVRSAWFRNLICLAPSGEADGDGGQRWVRRGQARLAGRALILTVLQKETEHFARCIRA